jgi:hypothetical protein
MNYERYESLLISADSLEFKFISGGPNGEIPKVVQFMKTSDPSIFNLAFGDLLQDGRVDDHVKNNNKDRNKILATVAARFMNLLPGIQINTSFLSGVRRRERGYTEWH